MDGWMDDDDDVDDNGPDEQDVCIVLTIQNCNNAQDTYAIRYTYTPAQWQHKYIVNVLVKRTEF